MKEPRRIPTNRRRGKFDEERERRLQAEAERRGLGDWIADRLSSIGITESRVNWVLSRFVESPNCGCSRRRGYLNRFGWRVAGWWMWLRKAILPAPPGE